MTEQLKPNFEQMAARVFELRRLITEEKRQLSNLRLEAQRKWEEDHQLFITDLQEHENQLALAEKEIESAAIQWFNQTGDKKPTQGIQIKVFKKLDYHLTAALEWAMSKQICLSLDKRSFEKVVGAMPSLPAFVRYTFEPRVQFASKNGEDQIAEEQNNG